MAGKMLTAMEIEHIVRKALRDELANAGLLLDEENHVFDAREDFRFLRRLRQAIDGTASKIGYAFLLAIVGGVSTAVWQGFKLMAGK